MAPADFVHTGSLYYRATYQDKERLKAIYKPTKPDQGGRQRWMYQLQLDPAIYSFFYIGECPYIYLKITFTKITGSSPEERIWWLYRYLDEKLSPYIPDFSHDKLCLGRIDLKIDIAMNKNLRETYLGLLNRGYMRYSRKEKCNYKTSCYYQGKSFNINVYDKPAELLSDKYTEPDELIKFGKMQFLRVEIQARSNLLWHIREAFGWPRRLETYYSVESLIALFEKCLRPIILEGDYYQLSGIKDLLRERYSKYGMAEKLESFLLNIEQQGIDKVKSENPSRFYAYKNKLESIGVHPILIPEDSQYAYLPNLYEAALETFLNPNYNIARNIIYNKQKEK